MLPGPGSAGGALLRAPKQALRPKGKVHNGRQEWAIGHGNWTVLGDL